MLARRVGKNSSCFGCVVGAGDEEGKEREEEEEEKEDELDEWWCSWNNSSFQENTSSQLIASRVK